MFERSLSMFNPFNMPGLPGLGLTGEEAEEVHDDLTDEKGAKNPPKKTRKSTAKGKKAVEDDGELSDLQAQLAAMQKQLDSMVKK